MANPPMDPAPSRAEESGQLPRWSPSEIKDAYVRERIDRWALKREQLDDDGYLAKTMEMSVFPPFQAQPTPGIILSLPQGGYSYIPLIKGDIMDTSEIPPCHMEKIHALGMFEHNPANAEILKAVEIQLDMEIEAENLGESTNSADGTPKLGFHSKVELVARHRLCDLHSDILPYKRPTATVTDMKVLVCDITEYGDVESKNMSFAWTEPDNEILEAVESFTPPEVQCSLNCFFDGQNREMLEPDLVRRVDRVLEILKSHVRLPEDPDFEYCLSQEKQNETDLDVPPTPTVSGRQDWSGLSIPTMKKKCKETGGWAVIMRPWKRRLAQAWAEIKHQEAEEYERGLAAYDGFSDVDESHHEYWDEGEHGKKGN